jgi:hypothetical protein
MEFFRRRPSPAPAANVLTQNQANAALVKALHNVANVKLRNALTKAKATANAAKNGTIAERNKTIAELKAALNEAKPVVTAAANVSPNTPVENATLMSEANVTAYIAKIQAMNNMALLGNISKNVNFAKVPNANKNRVRAAANNRRLRVQPPPS